MFRKGVSEMNCECGHKLHQYFHYHSKGINRYICHSCNNRYEENEDGRRLMDIVEITLQEQKAFKKLLKDY